MLRYVGCRLSMYHAVLKGDSRQGGMLLLAGGGSLSAADIVLFTVFLALCLLLSKPCDLLADSERYARH